MEKMKNILYKLRLGLLGVISTVFMYSCDGKEDYDIYGDSNNKIYITNPVVKRFEIKHTLLCSVGNLNVKLSISGTKPADGDINAELMIDNSLIAEYNQANGTSYMEMNPNMVSFEQKTLSIVSGKMHSDCEIGLTVLPEKIRDLDNLNGYLLPIKIKEVKGNALPSENVVYVTVKVDEDDDNYWESASLSDVNAVAIEDRSEFTIETISDSPVNTNNTTPNQAFNGKFTAGWFGKDYYQMKSDSPLTAIIDLRQIYPNIVGFKLYAENGRSLSEDWTFYVSEDKENWIKCGTTLPKAKAGDGLDIVFYKAVDAQYIRIDVPVQWNGSYSGNVALMYLIEFYPYQLTE